jgi:acetolactate synthase-1/2/3 large subunit
MNIQELQTVVTYGLPVKIILLNNEGYHSIRQTQKNFFGRFAGIGPESGDLKFPDMEKVSNAYGIPYFRIESNEGIESGLSGFFSRKGYGLCEVMCDKDQFFEPKLMAKRMEDGTIVSPDLSDMYPFLPRDEYEERMKISK